ncbi:MAG: cysteine hydrolase [Schwartzia succinivorans]|nr:cysteine hydrolase [Schwartzia succinivorans]
MKKALVVIDMQNDFIDGSLGTPEAQAIVLSVSERVKAAVQDGEKLIFTQDTHPKNYLQTAEGKKLPVEHCIKPSHGWALNSSLIPYAKDAVVLEKPTFGATGLPQHVAGFDEITVIGLCTDICVISNAMLLKAFLPEAKICVDSKCCAGITPKSHLRALEAMKMCQIDVI